MQHIIITSNCVRSNSIIKLTASCNSFLKLTTGVLHLWLVKANARNLHTNCLGKIMTKLVHLEAKNEANTFGMSISSMEPVSTAAEIPAMNSSSISESESRGGSSHISSKPPDTVDAPLHVGSSGTGGTGSISVNGGNFMVPVNTGTVQVKSVEQISECTAIKQEKKNYVAYNVHSNDISAEDKVCNSVN
jgi:hypothetical protein